MRELISYCTAALTALALGILSFGSAAQAQGAAMSTEMKQQNLSRTVQYYPERRYDRDRHHYDRRYDRPRYKHGPRWRHSHKRPYYRPYERHQYRYYRPAPPRHYRKRIYRSGRNAHINWCYNRYRSYRASDNTFQPYNGPRRQCYSPFI